MTKFQDIGKPIVIASHPRSGTHLTIDLLRKQFAECKSYKKPGEPLDRLYFALESFASVNKPLPEKTALNILSRAKKPIIKTHSDPQFTYLLKQQKEHWVSWLQQEAETYYICRDGRAVLCSLHLFMQSYEPKTRCSFSEFIRQQEHGCSRIENWAKHIQAWSDLSNIKLLRFEDIIKNPNSIITKIGQDLKLLPLYQEPLLPQRFSNIWHSRWARMTNFYSESTAIIGYYKNQKVQKWQEVFTEEDRKLFHQEAGNILIDLGYEKSDYWVSKKEILNLSY
ncbi:Sulfotransferase domain protein (modular protein) [Hyella patelloides LEGE 07179]|uniref:Sulfotransferase domain protein (Modular protein) n=1 Tax=Hyella patelloides LEGE 07179 TaxID=945734 RepID=A0A563VLL6_9CYAN|nr:sulfotransferase domain-containing protein [Hyella patelloides]VEP12247.1 Sulfotransferase domain protein (modular protein) [Hyella patelloides LEGE 07179]